MKKRNPSYKYDPYIDDYMQRVESKEIITNKYIKQLMKYTREKLSAPGVTIDHKLIDTAVRLAERYFFALLPWQKFLFAFVFGVRDKNDHLLFNEFFLYMGRGAGKNATVAALAFCMVYLLNIPNYNITFVANSEEQAKRSFYDIWNVLESNPALFKPHFRWTRSLIKHRRSGSTIRYSTSNPKTADGGRPGAVIFDEIHQYETAGQLKVHTSGLGKIKDARRFYITSDGYVRDGFLDQMKEESKLILTGERPRRKTFCMIYNLDKVAEYKDPKLWVKAVPSVNDFDSLQLEMMDEFEKLEDRPDAKIEFLTKRMNVPMQDSYNSVTSWKNILATNQKIPDLSGRECMGGIDYSSTEDFTGCGLLFIDEDRYYWLHHTFINKKSLDRYNYKVPIDKAIMEGYVTVLDTPTNRPEDIASWFIEQGKKYQIKGIAADMYRVAYLSDKFKELGLPELKIARSGTKTHTALRPIVEDLFSYHKIIFGDDLMMRWYTNNVYVRPDGKGNISYEKIDPRLRKTDGFMAFLHALQFRGEIRKEPVKFRRQLQTMNY